MKRAVACGILLGASVASLQAYAVGASIDGNLNVLEIRNAA